MSGVASARYFYSPTPFYALFPGVKFARFPIVQSLVAQNATAQKATRSSKRFTRFFTNKKKRVKRRIQHINRHI